MENSVASLEKQSQADYLKKQQYSKLFKFNKTQDVTFRGQTRNNDVIAI